MRNRKSQGVLGARRAATLFQKPPHVPAHISQSSKEMTVAEGPGRMSSNETVGGTRRAKARVPS